MSKSRKIYIAVAWILVIACTVVIFSLSAQNGQESSNLSGSFVDSLLELLHIQIDEGIMRTFAHGLEFMGLSVLLFNAVYATWETKLTSLIAFLGTFSYAITDEIHQIFVPGRAFQIIDILVDSTGAIIGVVASFIILQIIKDIQGKRK